MPRNARKSVTFLGTVLAALLIGCSDSSPSESTIEKQVAARYSDCKLISIKDFKKLNGFAQNNGTYIEDISFKIVLTPSSKMKDYVNEYSQIKDKVDASMAEAKPKIEQEHEKIQSMRAACQTAHDQKLNDVQQPPRASATDLDAKIMILGGKVRDDRQHLAHATQTIQFRNSAQQMGSQADIDRYKAELAADEANLQEMTATRDEAKAKSAAAWTDYQNQRVAIESEAAACQANVEAYTKEKAELLDAHQIVAPLVEQFSKIRGLFDEECPKVVIGGVLSGYFDADPKEAVSYGKEWSSERTAKVQFVKSDNGWIMQ